MTESSDFAQCMRQGKKCGGRFVTLSIAAPTDNGAAISAPASTLVGFTIAKRQVPRAVDRNRVKRRLRAIMRSQVVEIPQGARVVVMAKAASTSASFSDLSNEIAQLVANCLHKLSLAQV